MLLNQAWADEWARRAARAYEEAGMPLWQRESEDPWLVAARAKEAAFWAARDAVVRGDACWVDGWRAVTYGAGPGDDRYRGTPWVAPGDDRFRNLYAGKKA